MLDMYFSSIPTDQKCVAKQQTTVHLHKFNRSIEWDLEDLDDTVQIVEKNPAKFRIDGAELGVRKGFIASTRDEVAQMKRRTEGDRRASGANANAVAGSTEEVGQEIFSRLIEHEEQFQIIYDPNDFINSNLSSSQAHMDSVNLGSPTSTSHLVGPASGMASAAASANLSTTGSNKYSRLPNESDSPGHVAGGGSGAFGRAMQQQQQLVRDQVESPP